jgi:hypothetical protein
MHAGSGPFSLVVMHVWVIDQFPFQDASWTIQAVSAVLPDEFDSGRKIIENAAKGAVTWVSKKVKTDGLKTFVQDILTISTVNDECSSIRVRRSKSKGPLDS